MLSLETVGGLVGRGLKAASAIAALSGAFLLSTATNAQDLGSDVAKAFKDGQFNVSFRYRYEFVEDDNPTLTQDANASTLRSRLTYQTAPLYGFAGLLEMDDLRSLGDDNYNSTRNGEISRPTVADPEATDLNQAAIKYTGLDNTEIVLGRQRILRGNERFIGPVGWRQNEQTMDSASVNYKFGDKLQAYYAYVSQVNRVNGPDSGTPPADLTGNTHLADVTYTFGPALKLTAYGYFIDLEELAAQSSQTLGLRLAGDVKLNEQWSLPYAAEYATQDDYGDNPSNYDADYYVAEAGVKWQKLSVKLVYEVLEGSTADGEAFQTPLATLHLFQGWGDKFLTTPTGGIEDSYLLVEYALLGANLKVRYDVYQTESGSSQDYGDELGLWATLPVGKNYSVSVKYATFNADSSSTPDGLQDTDKFWIMLGANF
jgi:hypothetical protein